MEELHNAYLSVPTWAIVSAAIAAATLALIVLKRIILVRIARLVDKTPFRLDTLLVQSLSLPLTFVILAFGVMATKFALSELDILGARAESAVSAFGHGLLIIAAVLFADKFTAGAVGAYANRSEALRTSKVILVGVTRGIVLGLGLLVILGSFGVSITPIIASLGITSLAVALALRPTLENFFSGVQLVVDKPFRLGDYIELESGEQGFVDKIGWRSTWVRMLPNNIVIMPNSELSQSKIINYFYPQKELSVPVECSVHYDSDLEHVETVAVEVARQILEEHEYGVETYSPFVLYTEFDDSSINFTVMLRAHEYFHRFFIKSAYMKALHKRFREEGIVIPFPIRAINIDQEKAGALRIHTATPPGA